MARRDLGRKQRNRDAIKKISFADMLWHETKKEME
jgi:hypothetical protein